jgi:hypothetical protein
MTTKDKRESSDAIDALLDDVFQQSRSLTEIPGMEFKDGLLASYDAYMRRRKNRLSLALFADAIGWRALARPFSAAAALGSVCVAGFIAGAATPSGEAQTYAELSSAFEQSFALNEENASWAED